MSPVWAICTREGSTPSSSKISICRGPVSLAGREWAMTGVFVRTLARAAARLLPCLLGQTRAPAHAHHGGAQVDPVLVARIQGRAALGAPVMTSNGLDPVEDELGELVVVRVGQVARADVDGGPAEGGQQPVPVARAIDRRAAEIVDVQDLGDMTL